MMPTLVGASTGDGNLVSEGGDYIFVNTRATPDYFDIVVVKTTDTQGKSYDIIKRVVAFGGDTVKIDHGKLYIKYANDEEFTEIDEPYVLEENCNPLYYLNNISGQVVEEGHMFLLGDNRDVSEDSRKKGTFPISDLVGVVPKWSLKHKSIITSIYTFFEFKLGLSSLSRKIFGN